MQGEVVLKSLNPLLPCPAPWCELKSRHIPAPPPLQGGKNPCNAKRGEVG